MFLIKFVVFSIYFILIKKNVTCFYVGHIWTDGANVVYLIFLVKLFILICKAIKSIKGFVINIMTNFQTILKIYVYLMGNCTNLPHKNAFFSKLIYLEKRVDKHVF